MGINIKLTGLKSVSKFIGLEDTPIYYENGKFFKVSDNRVVYTDIEWSDIKGDISESKHFDTIINTIKDEALNEALEDIIQENISEVKNDIDIIENKVENNTQLIKENTPKWASIEKFLN